MLSNFVSSYSMTREASEDVEIGGYKIPRGTVINLPFRYIQLDPEIYPEPEVFNPDRYVAAALCVLLKNRCQRWTLWEKKSQKVDSAPALHPLHIIGETCGIQAKRMKVSWGLTSALVSSCCVFPKHFAETFNAPQCILNASNGW